jgi:hypothetical protein
MAKVLGRATCAHLLADRSYIFFMKMQLIFNTYHMVTILYFNCRSTDVHQRLLTTMETTYVGLYFLWKNVF